MASPAILGRSARPRRFAGWAWLALCAALALHVADEALNDFLDFYNPAVERIRESFPWFPMPALTFQVWLGGLVAAILLLTALSPFAFRGARWMVPLASILAAILFLNGCAHLLGSFYFGRLLPGVYSSPFLLAASLYMFHTISRLRGQ